MPKTCCSCHSDDDGLYLSADTCMCGCGYFNGWKPIVGTQLLLMTGMFFSIAALGDCSLMELTDNRLFFPPDMDHEQGTKNGSNLPIEVTQTQFVGFLTWKKLDGSCYYYNYGKNPDEQIKTYIEILGLGWKFSRICAGLSAMLSVLFFFYMLSFNCSSQVRGVRYFDAVFLCVMLTTLQGLTFVVSTQAANNYFCDQYGCEYSRSAGFSIAAIVCFFLSGLFFVWTHDYPGSNWKEGKKKKKKEGKVAMTKTKNKTKIAPAEMAALAAGSAAASLHESKGMLPPSAQNTVEEIESGKESSRDRKSIFNNDDEDHESNNNTTAAAEQSLKTSDNIEVVTEISDNEVRIFEAVTHGDGSQSVTKTIEEIAMSEKEVSGQLLGNDDDDSGEYIEEVLDTDDDDDELINALLPDDGPDLEAGDDNNGTKAAVETDTASDQNNAPSVKSIISTFEEKSG